MLTEEQLQDIFEMADILSNGDKELFLQLREIVFTDDPNQILDTMEKLLEPHDFDLFLDKVVESERDNLLLILMTLLEHFHYICVRPLQDELTDFIQAFDTLQQVREAGILLKMDSDGLHPFGNIPEWASVIDQKYGNENYCVGAIAMYGNRYDLFFTTHDKLKRLQELGRHLNYRIDFAKHM